MKKRKTFLIRFAQNILKALRIKQIRLFGHKFSKKTYTLHQHIVLLALREYHKGMGFRRFCELLPDYSLLLEYLGLSQIPHFTTLHKVSQRLSGSSVERIFLGFARKAKFRAGIDSTGMSLQHSTHYYERRLEHFRKAKKKKPGRPRKKRKKKHQYTSIFADIDEQIILSTKLLRGSKSDNKMMQPTIKKAQELFNQIISNDADKGYDAEYNHAFTKEKMKVEDYIKLKNKDVPVHRTSGENRKKAKQAMKKKRGRPRKNHRNKMETIMFVLKKVFGEHITATTAKGQRQQARFRIISYNAYRKTILVFLEHFYGALKTKHLNSINSSYYIVVNKQKMAKDTFQTFKEISDLSKLVTEKLCSAFDEKANGSNDVSAKEREFYIQSGKMINACMTHYLKIRHKKEGDPRVKNYPGLLNMISSTLSEKNASPELYSEVTKYLSSVLKKPKEAPQEKLVGTQ